MKLESEREIGGGIAEQANMPLKRMVGRRRPPTA
jgi:hypothetical protein